MTTDPDPGDHELQAAQRRFKELVRALGAYDGWLAYRWEHATPEQWAGRRRMAETREACGVALDRIDREALDKGGALGEGLIP